MKKVLIVDDEFLIRFTLEEGLKDRGYETQSAETVKDALEKMKTFHPQVILLDNRLQDSLGIDEISTFRSADEEVQVILMTAYGSVAQAVEATKRGAYDYILKPFDIDGIDRIAMMIRLKKKAVGAGTKRLVLRKARGAARKAPMAVPTMAMQMVSRSR